jgi:aspartyl protease family protein
MRSLIVFAGLVLGAAGLIGTWFERGTSAPAKQPEPRAAVAAAPASSGSRTVSIGRDHRGHFQANGRVDGRQTSFMVDTGASVIALTQSSAARIGIRPSRSDFNAPVSTANGVVKGARTRLDSVNIGGLEVRDVQAMILPDEVLSENLLGLSYLSRLRRFEFAGGKLVLEQ